jgi:energy-coupling factor transport system ATP-binding protein
MDCINPIEIQNAAYRYEDDGQQAVDHVSLSIPKGAMIAVLGHNGSGKSTLAKLMNALYLPTEGRVLVCGLDTLKEDNLWDVRRHAGMVFQNPDNQIVATVVREDVWLSGWKPGRTPAGDAAPHRRRAGRRAHDRVRRRGAPHALRRAEAARGRGRGAGHAARGDDPGRIHRDAGPLRPEEVFSTVQKLNREKGITVVWITHFMEEAALCGRVVVLHHGAIAMDGSPREVFARVTELKQLGWTCPRWRNWPGCCARAPAAARGDPDGGRYGKGADPMPIQVEHLTHTYLPGSPFRPRPSTTCR